MSPADADPIEDRLAVEIERLSQEFSALGDRRRIEDCVQRVFRENYRNATVTQYVPLFVYRHAREEIAAGLHSSN